jgi:hypothetical protein
MRAAPLSSKLAGNSITAARVNPLLLLHYWQLPRIKRIKGSGCCNGFAGFMDS